MRGTEDETHGDEGSREPPSAPAASESRLRLTRSFLAQLFSFAAAIANRVALTAILTRAWELDQLTDWVVALSIAALVGIPDACIQILFGNMYHASYAKRRFDRVNRWVGISLLFYGTIYGAVLLVAMLVLWLADAPALLHLSGGSRDEITWLIALLIAERSAASMRGALTQLYRAVGDAARMVNSGTLQTLVSAAAAAIAVLAGATPIVAAAAMLTATILFGFFGLVIDLKRRMPWLSIRPTLPGREELRHVTVNAPWFAIDQTSYILLSELPTIALAAAGIDQRLIVLFVLTRTVVNLIRQVQSAAAVSLGLEMAHQIYAGKLETSPGALVPAASFVALGSGLLAAVLATIAPTLMAVWSGRSDLFDPFVFLLLIASVLFTAPMMVFAMTLIFSNRPVASAASRLVHLALLLLGSGTAFLTDPFYGIVAALAGSEIAAQSLVLPFLLRRTEFALSVPAYARMQARTFIVFVAVVGPAFLLEPHQGGWPGLLVKAAVSSVLALLIGYSVMTKWERRQVRMLAARFDIRRWRLSA